MGRWKEAGSRGCDIRRSRLHRASFGRYRAWRRSNSSRSGRRAAARWANSPPTFLRARGPQAAQPQRQVRRAALVLDPCGILKHFHSSSAYTKHQLRKCLPVGTATGEVQPNTPSSHPNGPWLSCSRHEDRVTESVPAAAGLVSKGTIQRPWEVSMPLRVLLQRPQENLLENPNHCSARRGKDPMPGLR
jgi:hypothetical protein